MTRIVLSLLLLLGIAPFVRATIVSHSTGGDLTGAVVTVTWQETLSPTSFVIPVPPFGFEDSAVLIVPGFFSFEVDNETLTSERNWRLTNNRSGFSIISFVIDLTNAITATSRTVFDSGTPVLAAGSEGNVQTYYGGTNGVRPAAGEPIGISSFAFTNPYLEYGGNNIFLNLSVSLATPLPAGSTFDFNADSDQANIPEPATCLPLAVLAWLGFRRHRSSRSRL